MWIASCRSRCSTTRGQVVGVVVHVMAVAGLGRAAVPAAIWATTRSRAEEEHHLGVPVVRGQRPAVAEHDRLSRSPVLVEDLGTVAVVIVGIVSFLRVIGLCVVLGVGREWFVDLASPELGGGRSTAVSAVSNRTCCRWRGRSLLQATAAVAVSRRRSRRARTMSSGPAVRGRRSAADRRPGAADRSALRSAGPPVAANASASERRSGGSANSKLGRTDRSTFSQAS